MKLIIIKILKENINKKNKNNNNNLIKNQKF